ncbi:MAG: hypothetical protein PHV36_10980 [Elusimicrobiales bacterium]|nr:hypothetical protein [Elusimicrobiales bacterium]
MKNKEIAMLFSGLLLCAGMQVLAEEKSSDEKKLDTAVVEMDKEAGMPACQESFQQKIKSDFGVDDAMVQGLRGKNMGYGEISIALGLAQQLPGGITEANVQKITALRQGPPVMGWGRISRDLGLKLGPVTSRVRKISAEVSKQGKADKMKKAEKGERAGKPERPEKPEKMNRPEKGGRPEGAGKH